MQRMLTQLMPRPAVPTRARCLVLAVALAVLAGCATGGKPQPEIVDPTPAPPAGPSVQRLTDGREGLTIMETPSMDAEARRDFERAVALLQSRDYEPAISLLEKVIGRSPGVTAPYVDIAIAYRQTGKPEQAEPHLQTALALLPGHPVASNEYGLLLRQTGRFAEARTIYEKTLATFPDYLPARRNLGILCDLYLNDPACAREQYEIYSAARPGDEQVRMWMADLLARMGQHQGGGVQVWAASDQTRPRPTRR